MDWKSVKSCQRPTSERSVISSEAESGYGKPLVTPINKRLLVKRNIRPVSSPVSDNKTPAQSSRNRSPILSWKAENGPSSICSTPQRGLSKINVLPNKTTTSRDKRPAATNAREVKNPPLIAFNTVVKVRPGQASPELKSSSLPTRPASAKKQSRSNSTVETKFTKTSKPTLQDEVKSNAHKSFNNQNENFERLPSNFKTTFANYSSKSYKPQLEDIKSSHFVLNVKKNDRTAKRNSPSPKPSIQKPQPLIEEQRRIALLQAKNKFKTKKFWDDARYEKIEGLNWVSWK